MSVLPKKQLDKALKLWWVLLITGVILITGGFTINDLQDENFFSLTSYLSIFCFITGSSLIIYSITNKKTLQEWGWHLSNGIIDIIIGVAISLSTPFSPDILPFFAGFWIISKSTNGISFSIDLREYGVRYWWWISALCILLGIIGLLLIAYPIFNVIGPIHLTSWFLVTYGIVLIGSAMHLRKLHELPQKIVNKVTNSL